MDHPSKIVFSTESRANLEPIGVCINKNEIAMFPLAGTVLKAKKTKNFLERFTETGAKFHAGVDHTRCLLIEKSLADRLRAANKPIDYATSACFRLISVKT